MMRKTTVIIFFMVVFGLLAGLAAAGQETAAPDEQDTIGRTPPRLSLMEGQVSFWRPGAEDWSQAQVNTALAPGDQLYAGPESRLEIQIGAQAFVRTGADTQVGLENQEPDFIQFKVTSGRAALDVRSIAPGRMVEVDTPNAAFTIETEGYYRLDVGDTQTVFIARRAGRATAICANGDKVTIGANSALTVEGSDNPSISSWTAPALDALDRWNYARTDLVLENQASARYVSAGTYGIDDLDRYGTWRIVPTYGAVWVPDDVAADWVPYSTGTWMYDSYYGWTWVDNAPWGWAPFHYGRWVRFEGHWCWAPGPRIIRPIYAPALVAFFGEPGVQVSIGIGGPVVGWVALGWGEPLIPWWGRPGFIHRPWWGGWRGPCIVNGRTIHHGSVIHVTEIHTYYNTRFHHAVVAVDRNHFGHGPVTHARLSHLDNRHLRPVHKAPAVRATSVGLLPNDHRGLRPPEAHLKRNVVNAGRIHTRTSDAGHAGSAFQGNSAHRPASGNHAPRVGHTADPRNGSHGSGPFPPTRNQDRYRPERRNEALPSMHRPSVQPPRPPAHVTRPAPPRVPAPTTAAKQHRFYPPEQTAAPRPPRVVNRSAGTRPAPPSPPMAQRNKSAGRIERGHDRGTSPSATHSSPQRPKPGSRPSHDRRSPQGNESDRSYGSAPNVSPPQNHHARSFDRGGDSSGPSQRFERGTSAHDGQGGRNSRGGRHGRGF